MATNQPATKRDVGGQPDKSKDKKESDKRSGPPASGGDKNKAAPAKKK